MTDEAAFEATFFRWRRLHRGSSWLLAVLALIHSALTFRLGVGWSPEAVWFLGTGLGLLLLALMNLAHVGLGPCPQPTAVAVRYVNWCFVAFGVAAVVAVPEPQAYLVLAALVGQALAGTRTLTGPA
jgi:hypothetical protein